MLIYYQTSFLLGAVASIVIIIWILFQDGRKATNRNFLLVALMSALWSIGFFQLMNAPNIASASFWRWFMESASIILPLFWIRFVQSFLNIRPNKKVARTFYAIGITIWILNLLDLTFAPGIFTSSMGPKLTFNYYPTAAFGYYLFFGYFASTIVYSLSLLYKGFGQANKVKDAQIIYISIAATLGFMGGGMTFLPTLNILVPPVGVIFFSLYPVVIAYAIFKHRLFDVRIITTEILMFILWVIAFIRIITSDSVWDIFVSILIFIFMVAVGLLLIRSMMKEIETRDQLEQLAGQLKDSNERLRQLDQLKTEFLSIATHQLRTPLTAIKGYVSLVLEGAYGKAPEKMQKILQNIFQSSSLMAETITDFMNVSRIELGHIEYNKADFNCAQLISEVVEELKPRAKEAGLELKLESSCAEGESPIINGDYGKVKYIFSNLIENAIKYTPKGSITVSGAINHDRHATRIVIEDTGIGINKDELDNLFLKFKRARNAHNINIQGTGLGLYVAREMVKAHDGSIWVESDGEGKGSRFIVELPYVRIESRMQ